MSGSFREEFSAGLEAAPRYALAIGTVLILLWPSARGFSTAVGWLPLWLLAMPLSALAALRLARRSPPRGTTAPAGARQCRRRSAAAQTARRPRPSRPLRAHAA